MAFSLITSTGKATANGSDAASTVTTDPIDTTGADFIVICVHANVTHAIAPTDNKGNTWTAGPTGGGAFIASVQVYYCVDPTVGVGHTFTHTASGTALFQSLTVSAWDGASNTPYAGQTVGNSGASNISLNTGAVVPANDNSLVLSFLSWKDGTAAVSGGSLSILQQVPWSSGAVVGGAHAYEIQTTATSRAAAWSWADSSTTDSALIAVFVASTEADPVEAAFVFGQDTTVTKSRAIAFGLDGNTNTHSEEGVFKVFGKQAVTQYIEVAEIAAPAGAANKARLYAVDNGSGKTQLVVVFGSGAAQVIATEP